MLRPGIPGLSLGASRSAGILAGSWVLRGVAAPLMLILEGLRTKMGKILES